MAGIYTFLDNKNKNIFTSMNKLENVLIVLVFKKLENIKKHHEISILLFFIML